MGTTHSRLPGWAKVVLGFVVAALAVILLAMAFFAATSEDADAALTNDQAKAFFNATALTGTEFYHDGVQTKAGGIKCDTVRNNDTWSTPLLGRIMKTSLKVDWCWNGNRITSISTTSTCDLSAAGSTLQAHFDRCQKNGFYKGFHGSAHGAFEAQQYYTVRQRVCGPFGICVTNPIEKTGKNITVVFSNGGFVRIS